MAQNYTRQSTLSDGDTITASLFNDEYNQLVNAFTYSSTSASSTGHRHDGSAGQGGNIFKIGDLDFLNKIEVDSTNNRWGFYVEVSSAAVEQIRIQDGAIVPVTTNDIDLGTASLQFKDLYIDGTANVDSLTLTSGATVTTILDEDDLSSDSATALVTQQSVKAYIDAQVTAQDLDFQADTGGALSIDLDSETLTFTGGTGVDTSGSGNAVTFAIDSTVATLTGTQTLTNKTLTAPTISGNLTTDGTIDGRDVATDGAKLDGIESGATADQTAAEIRTLVDSASDSNVFTDADHTKLDGIEASADVTDTTNVTAAGAVMDSELTSEASVKALNQGVATTDSPTFAGVTVNGTVEFDGLSGTGAVSVTDILDQDDMSSNSATALATQQSIKAYVDTTVAATNELVEDTTPQLGGDLASNGNDILFADNDKAIFGAGSDLEIYSDGSTSYIREAGPGNLRIAGAGVQITDTSFNKYFLGSGDVARLYHSDDEKLATTSTGIDVTGTASVDGLTVSGVAYIQSTTTPQLELAYNSVNITGFYRSGGDFQIKNDNGAGTPETSIVLAEDGAVTLYHDASAKLATTATGIDVTGTVTADGLTVDKEGTDHLKITDTSSSNALTVGIGNTVGTVAIDPTDSVASSKLDFSIDGNTAIRIAEGGDISFYEDTGTTAKLTWSAADESLQIGTVLPQTVSGLVSRENGPAVEWGHGNRTSGYYGTLGTQYTNGQPYLSFSCDADSSGNTFTTRGFKGNVLLGTSTGDLTFNQLTNADASGQNLTERMRIDSSGLVGIGTSSPQNLLHVNKSDSLASAMQFTNSTTGATSSDGVFVGLGSGEQGYFWNYEANDLILGTSNAERMRIDSSGNVGIGTTSPATELHVDGKILTAGGSASSPALQLNDVNSGLFSAGGNTVAFSTDGSERMRIDSQGQVRLSNTTPVWDTTFNSLVTKGGWLGSQSTDYVYLGGQCYFNADWKRSNTGAATLYQQSFGAHTWYNTPSGAADSTISSWTQAMTLDASGNLLVGTTNTANVASQTPNVVTDLSYGVTDGSNKVAYGLERINFDSSNYYVLNQTQDGVRLVNGATAWTTQSDETLKENITALTDVLPKVQNLRCVSYNLKSQTENDVKLGFIAQDWQVSFPQVVNADPSDGKLGMNYTETIPVLLKAIQEQQDLIESLTARIAALEGAN